MKKVKFNSSVVLVLALILCVTLLSGCGGQKLSSDFDEQQVKDAAENAIQLINAQDSEGLLAICNVEMENALTDDVLTQIYEAIGEGGAFGEIEEMSVAGSTNQTNNEELAVVVVKANYEIKSFTYTLVFTKQMKLAGLFYK